MASPFFWRRVIWWAAGRVPSWFSEVSHRAAARLLSLAGAGVGVLIVGVCAVLILSRARASKEGSQVHAEKLAAYFHDMKSRGMAADEGPVFRLLWMLGLKVPPPLFLGTWGSFLYPVGVFAPMVLAAGAVLWWQQPKSPPWIMWLTASFFARLGNGDGRL